MAYALILVEGDTEEYFYSKVKALYKPNARTKIINLEGNFGINQKILDRAFAFNRDHPNEVFSVLICIDNESRNSKAPIDMEFIKKEIAQYGAFSPNRLHLFLARQDIESWFFHDVQNIYKFLKVPTKKRSKNYQPTDKYNHKDLSALFKAQDKQYRKGDRAENFINCLDLTVIRAGAGELNSFCNLLSMF